MATTVAPNHNNMVKMQEMQKMLESARNASNYCNKERCNKKVATKKDPMKKMQRTEVQSAYCGARQCLQNVIFGQALASEDI